MPDARTGGFATPIAADCAASWPAPCGSIDAFFSVGIGDLDLGGVAEPT